MAQFGLVEAGGTKFVLGIANEHGDLAASHRLPTTTPEETLGASMDWFRSQGLTPDAIGIASFGPLDLDPQSATWGHVARTPKPHWTGADLVGPFRETFACPVGIETDVNGAAMAEARWGAGQGLGSLLYLTIGTGVGGGYVGDGRLLKGLSHPEMGHIRVPRHPDDLAFAGCCPFHGDCLEGLAAGPSIIARWKASLSELGEDHPGFSIIAYTLAQAMVTFQAILEPARIVLGGGVTATPGLIEAVRKQATALAKGYFVGNPEEVIVAPGLGERSGVMGALAVALSSTS